MQTATDFYQSKLAYELDSSDLFEELKQHPNWVIVDTRKAEAHTLEHIPSAISFPHRKMNVENTQHLDTTKTYICYCDGIGCNASTKGALKLAQLGFQVKELIGGLDWWKRDNYATAGTQANTGADIQCAC